jgi:2-phospho-L-lactate guanylyltransferase (CobY/MobA/RfbA family)
MVDLVPGTYVVTAQLAGFATLVRQNVVVREGLNLTLDLTMTVGAINETVEVRADTPLLESRTVAQGVNISGDLQRALCIPLGIARQNRPMPSTVFCR